MWLYASRLELVPAGRPLRPVGAAGNETLRKLDATSDELYGEGGRPSIRPERLLREQLRLAGVRISKRRMLRLIREYRLLVRQWQLHQVDPKRHEATLLAWRFHPV